MEEDNKKDIKFSAEETDSGFDMEQTEDEFQETLRKAKSKHK